MYNYYNSDRVGFNLDLRLNKERQVGFRYQGTFSAHQIHYCNCTTVLLYYCNCTLITIAQIMRHPLSVPIVCDGFLSQVILQTQPTARWFWRTTSPSSRYFQFWGFLFQALFSLSGTTFSFRYYFLFLFACDLLRIYERTGYTICQISKLVPLPTGCVLWRPSLHRPLQDLSQHPRHVSPQILPKGMT